MMLWIIAAIAGAVVLAGIAFLALRREDQRPPAKPAAQPPASKPSTAEVEGTRMASIPPPSGMPFGNMSEELDRSGLESQELWVDVEDEPTGPIPKIVLAAAGKTDPGRKRAHNEDAYLVWPEHELYAIADGMGGYAAGEVASRLAVETLRDVYRAEAFGALEEGYPKRGAELVAAIRQANDRIRNESQRDEEKAGMGTTIVAARFSPGRNRVYVAHVGDSRCYRIRDGALSQLTTDHTLAAVGIQGPSGQKLSRAVGVFDDVDVDLTVDEPRPGDVYLLCSDGLYKMVPDSMIQTALDGRRPLQQAVEELVAVANERGGRDNVSVVAVRVEDPEVRESGEHRIPG
jgi:protein phosphatase